MMTENGCSEDLPCSQQRIPSARFAGSCFCGRPNERRTARRTTIGALSRTSAWQAGVSYSATFCRFGRDQLLAGGRVAKGHPRFSTTMRGFPRTLLALFPEDRCAAVASDASIVQLRLSDMRLCRPRQWGACWLAGQLWRDLRLEQFLGRAPAAEPQGYALGSGVLHVLVSYRLIAPGSEWKLHRDWFRQERHGRPVGGGLRTGGGRTSCTPVTTFCCSTKTRYSHI